MNMRINQVEWFFPAPPTSLGELVLSCKAVDRYCISCLFSTNDLSMISPWRLLAPCFLPFLARKFSFRLIALRQFCPPGLFAVSPCLLSLSLLAWPWRFTLLLGHSFVFFSEAASWLRWFYLNLGLGGCAGPVPSTGPDHEPNQTFRTVQGPSFLLATVSFPF